VTMREFRERKKERKKERNMKIQLLGELKKYS
jgi:hypothetical protein